jgi:hypothetical protein
MFAAFRGQPLGVMLAGHSLGSLRSSLSQRSTC